MQVGTPIYGWFKLRKIELEKICSTVLKTDFCIGRDMRYRCEEQHAKMEYFETMYGFPCKEGRKEFFKAFDCAANVMASHFRMKKCQRKGRKNMLTAGALLYGVMGVVRPNV